MANKKFLQVVAGVVLLAGAVSASASLAWFHPTTKIGGNQGETDVLHVNGSSASAYFAYGDGHPEQQGTTHKPYGIKTPRQLYNLAWLQYLGYFGDEQLCFELAANIDMSGWILPPIGTEENPFISYFDGQGYTISNLTVSNDFLAYNVHPTSITGFDNSEGSETKQPHILGLFGVVGNYKNLLPAASYNSAANQLIDTGINNITVKTTVYNSLMGLAAGYVSSGMSNVAVEKGTIDIDKNIATNTTSFGGFTNNISDYTIVGYTTNKASFKRVSESIYNVSVQTGQEFLAFAQGKNKGWGGSIDMNSVFNRIETFETGQTRHEETYEYDHVFEPGAIEPSSVVANTVNTQNVFHINKYEETETVNGQQVTSPRYYGTVIDYIDHADKHYLGGGVLHANRTPAYARSIVGKISDGNNHYLVGTGSNGTGNNAGTLSNGTSSQGSSWHIEEDEYVYIYITTTNNGNTTNRYLYWYTGNNSTVLRLGTGDYRTPFKKETITENGITKIRYTYNGRYLGYNGTTWTLIRIPSVDEPSVPAYPNQSDFDALKMTMPDNAANTKQIYVTSGGVDYFLTGSSSTGTYGTSQGNLFETGWVLDESASRTTIKLYGEDYYLYSSTTNSMSISTSSTNWYVTKSGSTYRFRRTSNGNNIRFNNGAFGISSSSAYVNVVTTEAYINNYNDSIDDLYDAAVAEYDAAVTYRDVTYPAALADLPNTLKATYNITFSSETITTSTDTYPAIGENLDPSYFEFNSNNTTYLPINVYDSTTYDKENTSLILGRKDEATIENTGYFVAGATGEIWADGSDSSLCPRSIIFSSYSKSSKLSPCYSNNAFNDSTIYTIDGSGVHSIVQNGTIDEEKYSKYLSSKTGLENVLRSENNVGGFHFYANNFEYGKVSKDRVLNAKNVRMGGETYSSYELPVNSLDFRLNEKGRINFLAGMYNGGGGTGTTGDTHMNGFFSFHRVFRDNDEKISDIKEIKFIYQNTTTEEFVYIYKDKTVPGKLVYEDNTTFTSAASGLKLLFSTDWIGYRDLDGDPGRVYYFEIPADEGEYCFGGYNVPGAVGTADGAYLMYLDIAAGAAKIQRTTFAEHLLEDISTTNHPLGVALIDTDTITGETPTFDAHNSACAVILAKCKGEVLILRVSNTQVSITRDSNSRDYVKPSYVSDTIQSVVDPGKSGDDKSILNECVFDSRTEKETYRIRYFDYDVNHETLLTTIIEDVRTRNPNTNSGAWSAFTRTISQDYDGEGFVTLTKQKQIDDGDIVIFKYFGPTGLESGFNGQIWTYDEIKVSSAALYYNGSETLTLSGISSTLTTEIFRLFAELTVGNNQPDITSVGITFTAVVDEDLSESGVYYEFAGYIIVPVVTNGNVSFYVKVANSNYPVYYVTVAQGNVMTVEGSPYVAQPSNN